MRCALLFALRELRSGVRGFRIFIACLALGVAALAAAGSTAEAFRQGLAAQTRQILGGDLSATVEGRRFSPEERAAFQALGRTTDALGVRAMVRRDDDRDAISRGRGPAPRRLAEVRGVDAAYPLSGSVRLSGAADLQQAMAVSGGAPGAALDPDLLRRLGLSLGARFFIGDTPFIARAAILDEPDRLGRGFALGPTVIVSRDALEGAGLVQGDALFGETVRIALRAGLDPARARAALAKRVAGAGVRIRGRNEAAAGLGRLIDQLDFFLSFIGLSSLLAGGLGVSNAVSAYLETRRPAIAVLKALGAEGALIRNTYLIQVAALSLLGVAVGLVLGALAPFALGALARGRLPVPVLFALYPGPLLRAALFGGLAAAAFSLGPLARARASAPASLFRRTLEPRAPFGIEMLALGGATGGLVWLVVALAPEPLVAGVMIAGVAAGFVGLQVIGRGAALLAGRVRGLFHGPVRLGLANLAGPRSAARSASASIGFGVALLAALTLLQSSLLAEVGETAPRTAPALIFTQIPVKDAAAFDADVAGVLGSLGPDIYRRYPFATGRIIALHGRAITEASIAPQQRWAFDRDLTLSALDGPPPDRDLVAGGWWPRGYSGPPLVMLDADIARGGGIGVGDRLTLSILGREVEARVAGLRQVDWSRFGASFPVIVDAAVLSGANLPQIAIAKADPAQEGAILGRLGRDFPAVNVISVREQLDAALKIFDQLAWAVRGAASVAALAGLLVLIGAIASSAQTREREAAVLKVLGSSRLGVLTAYAVEYGAVGVIAGAAGLLLGGAAAFAVVVHAFHIPFRLDGGAVAALLVATAAGGAGAGAVAALIALSRRPARALREGVS